MKKRPEPNHPGDILKQARIRAGYEPRVVIARLGVTNEVFAAIEAWDLSELPDNPHLIPILRRHASAVGADYNDMTKRFPKALKRAQQGSEAIDPHDKDLSTFVVSSIMKIALGFGLIMIVIGYVVWQGTSLSNRPRLDIVSPTETVVSTEFIELRGISSQGSQVFVNGTSILVSEDGEFAADIVLQEGPNSIAVRAVNNVGAEREEIVTIIRE